MVDPNFVALDALKEFIKQQGWREPAFIRHYVFCSYREGPRRTAAFLREREAFPSIKRPAFGIVWFEPDEARFLRTFRLFHASPSPPAPIWVPYIDAEPGASWFIMRVCKHCMTTFKDHADGKCLFEPSTFEPHWLA